jgi:hypothetical protein
MMATIEAPDQDGGVDPAFVVLSLPEVAALALRAARGAGLTWGMAEECGNAAVWLAAHGLDWSIDILARLTGEGGARIVPAATKWTSKGAVCGLHAGATLADFATLPEGPGTNGVRIGLVNHPLCLLPFAARAAKAMQSSLDVMLDDNLWASVCRCQIGSYRHRPDRHSTSGQGAFFFRIAECAKRSSLGSGLCQP